MDEGDPAVRGAIDLRIIEVEQIDDHPLGRQYGIRATLKCRELEGKKP